ncbi:MAG: PIG-L family deacetylase, partial [Gammaproteobacteria bacterium]|nr:PIG-L family deacetylase [Gammaproteobacteria bacterium]
MRVLVVAAHPDDEVLGVGGTIAWHAARGDTTYIFIPGVGRSEDTGATPDEIAALHDTAREVARYLGAFFVDEGSFTLPDNQLDTVSLLDVAKLVGDAVRHVRPDVVYTHHAHDLNVDHRRIHEAV